MGAPQKSPVDPGSLAARGINKALQYTNAHRLPAERLNFNSLLCVIGCHWDQAGIERRLMYLGALQMGKATEHELIDCSFDDFDYFSQIALFGAIVLRCPELFRHFVAEGYL